MGNKNCYPVVRKTKDEQFFYASCYCGWVGNAFPANKRGEQSALNDARVHIGRKPVETMSKIISRPVFAYEISRPTNV